MNDEIKPYEINIVVPAALLTAVSAVITTTNLKAWGVKVKKKKVKVKTKKVVFIPIVH